MNNIADTDLIPLHMVKMYATPHPNKAIRKVVTELKPLTAPPPEMSPDFYFGLIHGLSVALNIVAEMKIAPINPLYTTVCAQLHYAAVAYLNAQNEFTQEEIPS